MAPQVFGTKAEASAVGIVFSRRRRVHETGIRGIIAASVALSVRCTAIARASVNSDVVRAGDERRKQNKLSVAAFALVGSKYS
jgi:hypothetical protein